MCVISFHLATSSDLSYPPLDAFLKKYQVRTGASVWPVLSAENTLCRQLLANLSGILLGGISQWDVGGIFSILAKLHAEWLSGMKCIH